MSAWTAVALASVSLLAVVGAALTVQAGEDKMVICHKPQDPSVNRTMEIPRSAWDGHRGHGDHAGACGNGLGAKGGSSAGGAPRPPPPPPPTPTKLGVSVERSDGEVDGDAAFWIKVRNNGDATGLGLRLQGTLEGGGDWSVRPRSGLDCARTDGKLDCHIADLAAGATFELLIESRGPLQVCDEASIDLTLSAGNDASRGDDRVRSSAWVGACAPLDR